MDRDAGVLELNTDMASPKVAQIGADPRVALHVWVPSDQLQIRMRATAVVRQGDPELFHAPAAAGSCELRRCGTRSGARPGAR